MLLLPLILLVVFFFILASVGRRASLARQRAFEDEQRRIEEARRRQREGGGGEDELVSPFATLPFGGLLEDLMGGAGARSYRIDPRTGEWVDVSQERPEPSQQPQQNGTQQRTRPKRQRRQAQPQNPLASLLGGGMPSDGSGGFEVQPPDERNTFADVGGMDELKQEVRDTIGLMLQHPQDAERYGIEWNGILLYGPPGVGK